MDSQIWSHAFTLRTFAINLSLALSAVMIEGIAFTYVFVTVQ